MGGGGGGTPYATDITGMTGGRIIPGANSTPNNVSGTNSYIGSMAGIRGGSYDVGIFDANGSLVSPASGAGGGGWGASGGSVFASGLANNSVVIPVNIGGAGGKAINTNGNPVTFVGGSSRVFGVIG